MSTVEAAHFTEGAGHLPAAGGGWLEISLFDGFRLKAHGRPIELKNRKAQALLAALVLSPNQRETRSRVCGLLWSESSEQNARGSLRQTTHGLREAVFELQGSGLIISHEAFALDPQAFVSDISAVLEAAEAGSVHPLLLENTPLPERLLYGFEDVDPAFRVFLLIQRQTFGQRLERLLTTALNATGEDHDAAARLATALLNLDPTNELACRHLMQAEMRLGDTAAALKAYKALWDVLDSDYDSEPSAATQDLVVKIKTGALALQAQPNADPSRVDLPREKISVPSTESGPAIFLGIAQFDSTSVPQEKGHLVSGLRHDLIARLVRFRDWTVFDWDGGATRLREGAQIFTLEATARNTLNTLAVTLTIKEMSRSRYIWSETFVIDFEHWFDVQYTVVRRVAVALNVHISTERLSFAAQRPDVPLGVYDRWLRGHQMLFSWRAKDQIEATRLFESVVAEAPQFAPVYGSLVQVHNAEHIVFPGVFRDRERERRALQLAKTAVQSDPFDSRAHLCLAWSYAMNDQFDQALLSYDMALELNENDPWTLISTAQGLAFCGEHGRADTLSRQALSVDLQPSRSHWAYQVGIRFICGDYDGCIEAAERAEDVIPNLPAWKASALAHAGHRAEAEQEAHRFVRFVTELWQPAAPSRPETIYDWVLHSFPIRADADWQRLRDGLHLADERVPAHRMR